MNDVIIHHDDDDWTLTITRSSTTSSLVCLAILTRLIYLPTIELTVHMRRIVIVWARYTHTEITGWWDHTYRVDCPYEANSDSLSPLHTQRSLDDETIPTELVQNSVIDLSDSIVNGWIVELSGITSLVSIIEWRLLDRNCKSVIVIPLTCDCECECFTIRNNFIHITLWLYLGGCHSISQAVLVYYPSLSLSIIS